MNKDQMKRMTNEEEPPKYTPDPIAITITTIIGFAVAFILFLVLAAWEGIVFAVIWNWFVPPIFESAPMLSMPQAIGICLVIGLATTSYAQWKDHENDTWEILKLQVMRPAMVLIMGWLIRLLFF